MNVRTKPCPACGADVEVVELAPGCFSGRCGCGELVEAVRLEADERRWSVTGWRPGPDGW